jgi:hypothetical protein
MKVNRDIRGGRLHGPLLKLRVNIWWVLYGDDNVTRILLECAGVWSMISFAKVIKETIGMDYTSIAKGEIVEKHLRLEEVDFLGRRFVYRDGAFLAPLRKEAITGMLLWTKKPSNAFLIDNNCNVAEARRLLLEQNIMCASMEMFYYGECEWNSFRDRVMDYCRRYHVSWTGKSYQHWADRFADGQCD